MKTTSSRPMFYNPVFGNDNGYTRSDIVDVAAFAAPSLAMHDVALDAPASSKIKSK